MALYPLHIKVTPGAWRLFATRNSDPKFADFRDKVLERDAYTCQYCGKSASELTLDHVIPRRLGGSHTWENLATACRQCNHKKGGRMADYARMKLRKRPIAPSASAYYMFGRYLNSNQDWDGYIKGW